MSGWSGTRVLVTGAGGFIGSHVAEAAVVAGADVKALVRYNSRGSWGHLDASPHREQLEVVLGDIRDAATVQAAARGRDVILHLAALIGIPYSYEAPDSYVRTNIDGTLHVLDAARANGGRVVVTSTSEVYGTAQTVPMNETHRLNAQSPYAATKIGADMLALSYHRSFGVPVAVLRPFNTYGPRQSSRAVIPTIAQQLLVGDTVRIGSLTPSRDLTYVTDTAAAFLAIARSEGALGRVVNVGSGTSVTIAELIERIAAIIGRIPRIVQEDQRVRPSASEVDRLQADTSLASELFGWRPTVTLDDGLRRVVGALRAGGEITRAHTYAR